MSYTKMESPSAQSQDPAAESLAQKEARIRRERREAKIKAGGSARLDKITKLSGRPAEPGSFSELFISLHLGNGTAEC